MLRSIIICPDQELAARLQSALEATGEVSVGRSLQRYPNAIDLIRTLRAHAPEVVFLSFQTLDKAQEVVRFLESEADGIQIVAVHSEVDPKLLRETMRAGVREFLAQPFERQTLIDALKTVRALVERKPPVLESTSQIFAFLPSKAGVGTSTIALNISGALARRTNMHVLLADFDLNSGMMRFMLKLQNEYSVLDAVENSLRIDEHLWPQLVTSFGGLDVLHAGQVNPSLRIEGAQIRALMEFLRRNYQALCFDLSGNLERYSIEIMQDAKRILLVCTPEIPSLHLAREKIHYLKNFELDTRVAVILNRAGKKAVFNKAQVEEILGVPVAHAFPNDYFGVNRAMTAGTFLEQDSELGKLFTQFAADLVERRDSSQKEGKRKFLEFFAVPSRLASGEK
ncbi:MAG TPA: AAA family ATPase [Bryobacteraceae bacterium]|nr:AAA family ATPase [Bryobacteraceae bacterium]